MAARSSTVETTEWLADAMLVAIDAGVDRDELNRVVNEKLARYLHWINLIKTYAVHENNRTGDKQRDAQALKSLLDNVHAENKSNGIEWQAKGYPELPEADRSADWIAAVGLLVVSYIAIDAALKSSGDETVHLAAKDGGCLTCSGTGKVTKWMKYKCPDCNHLGNSSPTFTECIKVGCTGNGGALGLRLPGMKWGNRTVGCENCGGDGRR